MIILPKTSDKQKISKAVREKGLVIYKVTKKKEEEEGGRRHCEAISLEC